MLQNRTVGSRIVEAQRCAVADAKPRGIVRIRGAGVHREHAEDGRAPARPGAARIEPERGVPLGIEHLDDVRPRTAQLEVGAVGGDRGVRAGRLDQHDVAGVVDEAGNRVCRRARRRHEQRGQREREATTHSSARSQPTAVVTARAIQMTALVRHQAQ